MLALIAEYGAEMETAVREQIQMITDAMVESARFGKCPADLRGALIQLVEWLRSYKTDFMKWEAVTSYAHGEYLTWYSWITQETTRPRSELDGLSANEFYEFFEMAAHMTKQQWDEIFPEFEQERQVLRDKQDGQQVTSADLGRLKERGEVRLK